MSEDKQFISSGSLPIRLPVIERIDLITDQLTNGNAFSLLHLFRVGKTSILKRFAGKWDESKPQPTIGVEPMFHDCTINETKVKLILTDTAGQERIRASMPVQFYRRADACILVYDVTNLSSFTELDRIRDEVLLWSSPVDPSRFPFIVLGNKVELVHADPSVNKVSSDDASSHRLHHLLLLCR